MSKTTKTNPKISNIVAIAEIMNITVLQCLLNYVDTIEELLGDLPLKLVTSINVLSTKEAKHITHLEWVCPNEAIALAAMKTLKTNDYIVSIQRSKEHWYLTVIR